MKAALARSVLSAAEAKLVRAAYAAVTDLLSPDVRRWSDALVERVLENHVH